MRVLTGLIMIAAVIAGSTTKIAAETPLDHAPSREEIAQGRDLKLYDDVSEMQKKRLDAEELASLRAFIWDHWRQKKRAYARVIESDIDTANEFHIFIEQHGDIWRVVLRRLNIWAGGGVVRRTLEDLPEATTVERATPTAGDHPGDFVLVFRDRAGKEVKRL
jgi:hypothetical protein